MRIVPLPLKDVCMYIVILLQQPNIDSVISLTWIKVDMLCPTIHAQNFIGTCLAENVNQQVSKNTKGC